MTEHVIVPHTLHVWTQLRAMARPGDVIRTALRPAYDGVAPMPHAAWIRTLISALDEGIEVHVEECGSLRHGVAVLRALHQTMSEHEAETARRRAEAERSVAEAVAEVDAAYKDGFQQGQDTAKLAEKALRERQKDRDRKRELRRQAAEQDGKAAAQRAEAARSDIKSPNYVTSAGV